MNGVARVRGIKLAFEDAGEGAPVIFLHGFPFNRSMWREQVEALSGAHRVVAPDLRGHGSNSVTSEPATMEEMAADVAALLDELKIGAAVVAGLSMGGYVALAFAREYPSRVRALVLADTRAHADDDEGRRAREETAQRALRDGMEPLAEAMIPKLLAPSTRANRPDTVERARTMILNTEPKGAASALRGMALRRDQTDFLSSIISPVLILVGSDDAITPPSDAEAMHERIPNSELEVIEGAGHLSNIERPEHFNRALSAFLSRLQP